MLSRNGPLRTSDKAPNLREAMLTEEGLQQFARLVTIGELALCFSHEVKSPLSVLLGCARIMERALPKDDPIRIQLDSITRNGLRMKEMTESILNFGRKREVSRVPCAVQELIDEAVSLVDPCFDDLRSPSVDVKIHVEESCPRVAVDRWRIIHVLVNLLSNAADALTQSRQREIRILAEPADDSMVRILVSDTGTGMDADTASHAFVPFFTTKGERGNGLGLYIVHKTIEDHDGRITFETSAGGTVFSICLPAYLS